MASQRANSDIIIEPISSPDDFFGGFDVLCATFGRQTQDGFWQASNPGWDTPQGRQACAQRMIKRWEGVTTNRDGNANVIFLKATAPTTSEQDGPRKVVGFASWAQQSMVDGWGDKPIENLPSAALEDLYPGDEAEQGYIRDVTRSFFGKRREIVKAKATEPIPAVYALDLCVVDPAYQGRGIAKDFVKWGIAEAKRRGGLEMVTEGSVMGRRVYEKLGFKPQPPEVVYEYDPRFEARSRPSNLFMRTGGGEQSSA
ncbi:acetyltransferase (GNAT) family protein [Sarocladium implicatum]|nr:acetyltransferase (GNAT) family protein [Sarocladium implicatum]